MSDLELRFFPVEVRSGAKSKLLKGYAVVWNSPSQDLGGFIERVQPGAFTKTIQTDDIRALWNHDSNYVLGRNKSGTLRLAEDSRGLAVEIDPPSAQWARDLIGSIERGDVSQMSFGFRTIRDSWTREGTTKLRTLEECKLIDVSPVALPAYEATSIAARSSAEALRSAVFTSYRPRPARSMAADVARIAQILVEDANDRLTGELAHLDRIIRIRSGESFGAPFIVSPPVQHLSARSRKGETVEAGAPWIVRAM